MRTREYEKGVNVFGQGGDIGREKNFAHSNDRPKKLFVNVGYRKMSTREYEKEVKVFGQEESIGREKNFAHSIDRLKKRFVNVGYRKGRGHGSAKRE